MPNYPKLIQLWTDDQAHTAQFNVFNGMLDYVIFKNQRSEGTRNYPVVKMLFSLTGINQLKGVLNKIVSDPEAKPISIDKYLYNKDTKTHEFGSSMTIGRDTDKSIYIDAYSSTHKSPIRIYFVTDRSIRFNGNELTRQQQTEYGVRMMIDLLTNTVPWACLKSRRDSTQAVNGIRNVAGTASQNNDDEIPF